MIAILKAGLAPLVLGMAAYPLIVVLASIAWDLLFK
jgi:hypothetical protein